MEPMSARTKDDEQAIRDLVDTWLAASKAGDVENVLKLMSDDVIFMVPGREPFGKREFAANSAAMKDLKFEFASTIQEIKVLGDWAWMRNHLKVKAIQRDGKANVSSGYTLTILRRENDKWVLTRDANLLTPESVA